VIRDSAFNIFVIFYRKDNDIVLFRIVNKVFKYLIPNHTVCFSNFTQTS